jgi:o-succinylbenzoate synthase
MPSIVDLAVENMKEVDIEFQEMTEPEVVLSISKIISDVDAPERSLFISNSMPVRDAEAFLYSLSENVTDEAQNPALLDTGVNRGASGIDGIIASAAGFADSTHRPTTLLIGDVAALHDINSLHALRTGMSPKEAQAQKIHPLTIIVLNNDGGGIFSFLPIARHGSDVAFEEFFGTPTNTFSFEKGAAAFDLPFERVVNQESFRRIYSKAIASGESSIIEVVVAPRDKNVVAHKEITKRSNDFLATLVSDSAATISDTELLPVKHFSQESLRSIEPPSTEISKTLVLLHGWMGSKSEWDDVCASLVQSLPPEWSIIAIDLPGHGESQLRYSSDLQSVGDMLGLSNRENNNCASDLSIDQMASSVRRTLQEHGIESVDAIAGYSLGGRVALALKRMCMLSRASDNKTGSEVVTEETKFILVSAYPGEIPGASSISESAIQHANTKRLQKDDTLSREMMDISNRAYLMAQSSEEDSLLWSDFLHRWYSAPLWGSLNTSSYGSRKMIEKRIKSLSTRGKDFAAALMQCSPPRHRSDDWRGLVAEDTLFISGGLDQKYCSIGKEWATAAPGLNYHEIPKKGHALLVEAAAEVASAMNKFLRSEKMERAQHRDATKVPMPRNRASLATRDGLSPEVVNPESCPNMEDKAKEECGFDQDFWETIGSLDFEAFTIDLVDERTKNPGVFGSGWGANARESNVLSQRVGFIIQMLSKDGLRVGIGEVSPLPGLHPESLADAEKQLNIIASKISELEPETVPSFDATKILEMNGGMETYLVSLTKILGIEKLLPSIRSGIEMALISLASEVVRIPIHQALIENSPKEVNVSMVGSMLPLNGLITRGRAPTDVSFGNELNTNYESWKVKVGHQSAEDDAMAISYAFQIAQSANQAGDGQIRADANRGFNDTSAINFARALEEIDVNAIKRLEYVEEPLERRESSKGAGQWSLANQVDALERWYKHTSISYALDESISDLAEIHAHDFYSMMRDLKTVFSTTRGCAAFVLKPSLLGLELSMRLARAAKQELGIGAVFTSSFDSGVGLSYAAFLGSLSDVSPAIEGVKQYPHGLSTFSMLTQDCLSPSFGSYVNQNGLLNVASLSRAFYGLGLDEIQSLCIAPLQTPELPDFEVSPVAGGDRKGQEMSRLISDEFEASTATSSSGREIIVVASLPLPFSADIACARFTDLPQQPRWSPWISSVAYLDAGSETEWTLRVRGVNFRWRATSSLLEEPYRGIQWESVSGLKNTGVVEFISTGEISSLMKVRMVIVTPRILSSLFSGTSVFFEDFLRNKILKWSLEMFRDVVKGDLALEEGNIELGDALFGAVEGKANAIEATLSSPIDD